MLEALKLGVKVEDIVGLLIAECSVSVRGKNVNHILLFESLHLLLSLLVVVYLGNGVVDDVLFLDKLGGDLLVGVGHSLEGSFLVKVVAHVSLPVCKSIVQAYLLRKLADICN